MSCTDTTGLNQKYEKNPEEIRQLVDVGTGKRGLTIGSSNIHFFIVCDLKRNVPTGCFF